MIVFRCRLKVTGDMIVSFPVGIVQALRNNPWSTALSLHIKNLSHVDEILMNKELISEWVSFLLWFCIVCRWNDIETRLVIFFAQKQSYNIRMISWLFCNWRDF